MSLLFTPLGGQANLPISAVFTAKLTPASLLFTSLAAPKENVSRSKFAFSCKPGLTQGSNVHIVFGEFLSY
jgi:hypothetical protein